MVVVFWPYAEVRDLALNPGGDRLVLVTSSLENVLSRLDEVELLVMIGAGDAKDLNRKLAAPPLDRIPAVSVSRSHNRIASTIFGPPLYGGKAEIRFRIPPQKSLRQRAESTVRCEVSEANFVRKAMEAALTAAPPIRTVSTWADQLDVDRRTLWARWDRSRSPDSDLSPHEFLSWVQVLEGLSHVHSSMGGDWASTAEWLRVSSETLRRKSRQLVGLTLEELADADAEDVLGLFEDRVGAAFGHAMTSVSDSE